jgi:hypothetical protein
MLLTAIKDEETVLVRAMKRRKKKPIIPPSPMRAFRVYGMTMPILTSVAVSGPG